MSKTLPDCCTPFEYADLAERLYCAYNRGGDPATAGLNYQGKPCPVWTELPENIRAKWEAVAVEHVDVAPRPKSTPGNKPAPFTIEPTCPACGAKARKTPVTHTEISGTWTMPAAGWQTDLNSGVVRITCGVCSEKWDMEPRVPRDLRAESTPGTNPLPGRPASPPITGLPHMLAREMPTDPALPAITLDDAAVEPVK